MSRIPATFEALKTRGREALIPFITAGDPSLEMTGPLMRALVEAGADIIELGVPFSDPMADGPAIQRASERALKAHTTLHGVLSAVAAFRSQDARTPVVLMGYANPIEAMGTQRFAEQAADAGVDGVLVVDYPPEEAEGFAAALKAVALDPIFLLAPTSTEQRMKDVGRMASGYVYYVSLRGVTGAGHLDTDAVAVVLPRIREHVKVPLGVGFGIRDAATARAVARNADAVVIGSALVQLLEAQTRDTLAPAAAAFIAKIRAALDDLVNEGTTS